MPVFLLDDTLVFPPAHLANGDGVLAMGGDLSVARLVLAYSSGIFPWLGSGGQVLWWSPDPRMVLLPEQLHVSKSVRRLMRSNRFTFTIDKAFDQVIAFCKTIDRGPDNAPWITDDFEKAYADLHRAGFAHSVDVWEEGQLVGGLYGVSIGGCFYGESMFSLTSGAGKCGFVFLVERLRNSGFTLIDCQVYTLLLESFGAHCVPRNEFMELMHSAKMRLPEKGPW